MNFLYHYFKGDWLFDRQIKDVLAQQLGTCSGRAVYYPTVAGQFIYEEEGRLNFSEFQGLSKNKYIFNKLNQNEVNVCFETGEHFHVLDSRKKVQFFSHMCGEDRYFGKYVFEDDNTFRIDWKIKGPQKNLRIQTKFMRVA